MIIVIRAISERRNTTILNETVDMFYNITHYPWRAVEWRHLIEEAWLLSRPLQFFLFHFFFYFFYLCTKNCALSKFLKSGDFSPSFHLKFPVKFTENLRPLYEMNELLLLFKWNFSWYSNEISFKKWWS